MTLNTIIFFPAPFMGHILPGLSVASELAKRNHKVVWVGESSTRDLIPDSIIFEEHPTWDYDRAKIAKHGIAGFAACIDDLHIPMAKGLLDHSIIIARKYNPDVFIVDQNMYVGAVVARLFNKPWATLCTSSAQAMPTMQFIVKVDEKYDNKIQDFERDVGLQPKAGFPSSTDLFIVFSTQYFIGEDVQLPSHYKCVGPVFQNRYEDNDFPWGWLNGKPLIYISLGTVRTDRDSNRKFFAAAIAGLSNYDIQIVISGEPDLIEDVPENVLIQPYVPQVELLKKVDLVITHGGHNTTCEALCNGIPLIVAPMRHDQPTVAGLVEDRGAGVKVRYKLITETAIRQAFTKVYNEPSYREAACRLREDFLSAGGEVEASNLIEELAEKDATSIQNIG